MERTTARLRIQRGVLVRHVLRAWEDQRVIRPELSLAMSRLRHVGFLRGGHERVPRGDYCWRQHLLY